MSLPVWVPRVLSQQNPGAEAAAPGWVWPHWSWPRRCRSDPWRGSRPHHSAEPSLLPLPGLGVLGHLARDAFKDEARPGGQAFSGETRRFGGTRDSVRGLEKRGLEPVPLTSGEDDPGHELHSGQTDVVQEAGGPEAAPLQAQPPWALLASSHLQGKGVGSEEAGHRDLRWEGRNALGPVVCELSQAYQCHLTMALTESGKEGCVLTLSQSWRRSSPQVWQRRPHRTRCLSHKLRHTDGAAGTWESQSGKLGPDGSILTPP